MGFLVAACLLLPALSPPAAQEPDATREWWQWRGPLGTGAAPHADPPRRWSETENVRWKTPLPGRGHSTPIVVGDAVYLTAAVPAKKLATPRPDRAPGGHDNLPVTHHQRYLVLALDRSQGAIRWQREVQAAIPHEGGHVSASLASPSPVSDGRRVYASFGSQGVYCLEPDGSVVWSRDLGLLRTKHGHGEGSSPVLCGDLLVLNSDHEGPSYLVALNRDDGAEVWRVERDEVTSWASPLVVEHEGRRQIVISGTDRVRGYDPADGKVLWECGGLSANVVATPVAAAGMVFAASSYDHQALLAIRLSEARGDITGTPAVVWSRRRRTPDVPSPLLLEGQLYFLAHYQGVLSRVEAATGAEPTGPFRLPQVASLYASPVGVPGRLYLCDLEGTTLVMTSAAEPELLARNQLDDAFHASPALAGSELFLRGERALYCLAED